MKTQRTPQARSQLGHFNRHIEEAVLESSLDDRQQQVLEHFPNPNPQVRRILAGKGDKTGGLRAQIPVRGAALPAEIQYLCCPGGEQ